MRTLEGLLGLILHGQYLQNWLGTGSSNLRFDNKIYKWRCLIFHNLVPTSPPKSLMSNSFEILILQLLLDSYENLHFGQIFHFVKKMVLLSTHCQRRPWFEIPWIACKRAVPNFHTYMYIYCNIKLFYLPQRLQVHMTKILPCMLTLNT